MTTAELMALANDPGVPEANRDAIRRQLAPAATPQSKPTAPVRKAGAPNATEARYGEHLERLRLEGRVTRYAFEAVTLVVLGEGGKRIRYTPDWCVWWSDGRVRFVETKGGFIREDGRLKFLAAAEKYREWEFVMVQWTREGWSVVYEMNVRKEG